MLPEGVQPPGSGPSTQRRSFGVAEEAIAAARAEALVWALERGSRSGRVAYQFARDYAGRHA